MAHIDTITFFLVTNFQFLILSEFFNLEKCWETKSFSRQAVIVFRFNKCSTALSHGTYCLKIIDNKAHSLAWKWNSFRICWHIDDYRLEFICVSLCIKGPTTCTHSWVFCLKANRLWMEFIVYFVLLIIFDTAFAVPVPQNRIPTDTEREERQRFLEQY